MRAFAAVLFILVVTMPCLAADADAVAGRWQGQAQIPGRPLDVTVDLDKNSADAWIGSIVIPGMNIKGAPLADIAVDASRIAFAIKNAGDSNAAKTQFRGSIAPNQTMEGDFSQAGNTAKFSLKKVGAASVDLPLAGTPLDREFEGRWIGEYVFSDVPRHVTLTFDNHAGGAATAKFVIVGKKAIDVPVDLVRQDAALVIVQSNAYQITYEGRLNKATGQITGTFTQGPYEVPLNLHHDE
jgi:hypothetical protein